MTRKLNWGLLGTARINRSIIPVLQSSHRSQLLAVASRDERRARDYAQQWSIPRWFGSYVAMLADPEIDVVYVSLPNSLHAEWTVRAAQAGKHVLCEKPLAITVEEVDAIAASAQQNGVTVQEAFMYRHSPQTLMVQKMVTGGELGKIWLVRGAFSNTLDEGDGILLDPNLGGGCLWDVGCYPLSYARMVLGGEPVEVMGWQRTGESGVDMSFAGQLVFPSGAVAQIDSSFESSLRTFVEIVGTAGSLSIPAPFTPRGETRLVLLIGESPLEIVVPAFDLYSGEVENMADIILESGQPRVTLSDSRGNVKAIQALLRSGAEGKPVRIG